jgi:hypothetical protein
MLDRIRELSPTSRIGLLFMLSGIVTLTAGQWLVPAATPRLELRAVEGTVVEAKDIKHPRAPADVASYALRVQRANGDLVWVDAVKQKVAPEKFRALVGQPVSALVADDDLAYELTAEDGRLFGYDDTVRIIEGDSAAVFWSGVGCLVLGLLTLLWSGRTKVGRS